MAKEKTETRSESEHKGKRLHLHEMRTVQNEDGSLTHHHTYKEKVGHPHTMPERQHFASSQTPEDAGQHVEDQFGMNQMGGDAQGGQGGGDEEEPEGEEQPSQPTE